MKATAKVAKLRGTSLALAVSMTLIAMGVTCASAATSPGTDAIATVAHATVLARGDAVMGALPMSQPIHIEVALKLRDRDGLDAFIANNAKNQASGIAPQLMTSEQFLANHAPTQAQAQAVVNYLAGMGYRNIVVAPNRLLVSADGTAMTARNAFLTTFAQVRTHDGRVAFANTDEVRIPAALSDKVLSVLGLQTVHQAHTFVRRFDSGSAHTLAIIGHDPLEFPSIYGGAGTATAAGVTVGIVTEGNLAQTKTDLNTYTANNGLATVTTQTVNTNGIGTDTSGTNEWDLDSQSIVGMSGGQVGKIIFYNIPNLLDSSLTADINAAVAANQAKIINVSLGVCETDAKNDGSAAAQDQILQTAVAQGQTFSISTGDSGADECGNGGTTPSWPAASQYVIAAAGTKLNASTTTWSGETVWIKSGGSPSTFEPKPSWQGALVPGTKRGVADIAFDGDPSSGAVIVFQGTLAQFGGTSLSAPIFSGFWARAIRAKGTSVGFAGPLIYNLPVSDFHDITVGNNGGETAAVGYDFASGRGSIIMGSAIRDLGVANPQLLGNSGFETGTASPWGMPAGVLNNSASEPAHGGSWDVWLNGHGTANIATLWQQVAIPAGKTSATLAFYLHIDTAETTTTANDRLTVRVTDTANNVLAILATYSNRNHASGYVLHSLDMTPYIGQTVRIKFIGNENASLQTSFVLDDITLKTQ